MRISSLSPPNTFTEPARLPIQERQRSNSVLNYPPMLAAYALRSRCYEQVRDTLLLFCRKGDERRISCILTGFQKGYYDQQYEVEAQKRNMDVMELFLEDVRKLMITLFLANCPFQKWYIDFDTSAVPDSDSSITLLRTINKINHDKHLEHTTALKIFIKNGTLHDPSLAGAALEACCRIKEMKILLSQSLSFPIKAIQAAFKHHSKIGNKKCVKLLLKHFPNVPQ